MPDDRPELATLLARLTTELGEDHMRWVLERELMPKPTHEQIDTARRRHASDDVDIDDDAGLSEAEEGYWIGAWVWIDFPACGRCREQHDPKIDCDPPLCPANKEGHNNDGSDVCVHCGEDLNA